MVEKTRKTKTEILAEPALGSATQRERKFKREPVTEPLASTRPLTKEEGEKMLEKALWLLAKMPSSVDKAKTLADIASVMQKAGREEGARKLCEEAMGIAKNYCIAPGYIGWGIKERVDLAMGIKKAEDAPKRTRSFVDTHGDLIWRLEKAGRTGEALDVASGVIIDLARVGRTQEALHMASCYRLDSHVASSVAWQMAKTGKFEEALSVVSRIKPGFFRDEAEGRIASEMAKAGLFERAIALSSPIIASNLRSGAQTIIATEMAKAGKFGDALDLSSSITHAEFRIQAYALIASEMANAGMGKESKAMFRKALRELPKIESEADFGYAERAIASALANAFLATQKQEG